MAKPLNLEGKKFGDLVVKGFDSSDKHRNKLWLCECVCGNTVKVMTYLLTSGRKTNCGCKNKHKQDFINKKFGDLTVKELAGRDKHKNRIWLCECTCGNKVKVLTTYLISGQRTNCGCKVSRIQNLVNQKFGDLTVKKFAGINKKGDRLWLCECACGAKEITTTHKLTSGKKTNCGCKRKKYTQIFLDRRGIKERNVNLSKRYFKEKKKEKFCMPSLKEIEIWDKKFTALELVKKKLRKIKSVNELDYFLTLLSDQKINV